MRLDSPEADELLRADWFDERLHTVADELGQDPDEVRAEAVGYLREMAATHDPRPMNAWRAFGRWFMRANDVYVHDDHEQRRSNSRSRCTWSSST
jgi:glycerol-3-phosphate O-acyltransferase